PRTAAARSLRSDRKRRPRCAPRRSRAPSPSRERRRNRLLAGLERIAETLRVLPPRLGECRLAAAAAADVLAELANELRCIEAALDERLVEVDHDVGPAVVDRGHDRAVGLLLLANPVGEVSQGATLDRPRFDEQHVRLLVDDRVFGLFFPRGLFPFLAGAFELDSKVDGLACLFSQVGERLARGDGFDPPRACTDGALA